MGAQKVIVFWDLDTAPLQGHTAENAVAAIRQLAFSCRGGEIQKITAYHSPRAQLGPAYINELTLHGVIPKNTAFMTGPESTAKCLIVDLLIEMVDASKQPPMLLIVSDDPDMAYPASALKLRLRVLHVKSSFEHKAALQKVLAGNTGEQSPSNVTSQGDAEAEALVNSQSSPVAAGLPSPAQEGQAQHAQNPNLIPLQSQRVPSASLASSTSPKYRYLVEVLEEAQDEGFLKLDKALLGNKLAAKSKNIYQDAGVKDFKKYIAMAEADGIVIVGGGGTGSWVALKEDAQNPWASSSGSGPQTWPLR